MKNEFDEYLKEYVKDTKIMYRRMFNLTANSPLNYDNERNNLKNKQNRTDEETEALKSLNRVNIITAIAMLVIILMGMCIGLLISWYGIVNNNLFYKNMLFIVLLSLILIIIWEVKSIINKTIGRKWNDYAKKYNIKKSRPNGRIITYEECNKTTLKRAYLKCKLYRTQEEIQAIESIDKMTEANDKSIIYFFMFFAMLFIPFVFIVLSMNVTGDAKLFFIITSIIMLVISLICFVQAIKQLKIGKNASKVWKEFDNSSNLDEIISKRLYAVQTATPRAKKKNRK